MGSQRVNTTERLSLLLYIFMLFSQFIPPAPSGKGFFKYKEEAADALWPLRMTHVQDSGINIHSLRIFIEASL